MGGEREKPEKHDALVHLGPFDEGMKRHHRNGERKNGEDEEYDFRPGGFLPFVEAIQEEVSVVHLQTYDTE